MRFNKAALLALVSSAMLTGTAYAEDGDRRNGPGRHFGGPGFGMPLPEMMIERMAERLDLDDAQYETVQNIMSAAEPELQALRERVRANHESLRALDVSDAEVQNIAISNGELATEATLLFTRIRGEVNAVLTDEQRAKLAEVKERRKERFERRKGRR